MKHFYEPWSLDRTHLQGWAKLLVSEGEFWSHCRRCHVFVVNKKVGGYKFWVVASGPGKSAGKLVSKCPCAPYDTKTFEPTSEDRDI